MAGGHSSYATSQSIPVQEEALAGGDKICQDLTTNGRKRPRMKEAELGTAQELHEIEEKVDVILNKLKLHMENPDVKQNSEDKVQTWLHHY